MPALMGLSFLTILFVGKRLPKKGAEVGIAAVGLCFGFALLSGIAWIGHVNDAPSHAASATAAHTAAVQETPTEGGITPEATADEHEETPVAPIETSQTWFEVDDHKIEVGTFVDGL